MKHLRLPAYEAEGWPFGSPGYGNQLFSARRFQPVLADRKVSRLCKVCRQMKDITEFEAVCPCDHVNRLHACKPHLALALAQRDVGTSFAKIVALEFFVGDRERVHHFTSFG